MSEYLKIIGCPLGFVEDWNRHHITKHIMLVFGTLVAATGFYLGCKLDFADDSGSKLYGLAFFFLGGLGVFVMAFAIALYIMTEDRRLLVDNKETVEPAGRDTELLVQFQNTLPPYEDEQGLHVAGNDVNLRIQNPGRVVKIINPQELFAFHKFSN